MRATMRPIVEAVIILFYATNVTLGNFDFTIHLEAYQNPNNWRHTGTCCDNVLVNGTCEKCDTKVFFCLRRDGASRLTINNRTLSTSTCHLALFETSLESLPRDIHINSSSPWPNDRLLQLYMRIVDVDEGEFILTIGNLRITGDIDPDDVIDEWTHPIALRPGISLDVKPFTGVYSIASWRAGFSVKCSRGYFGSECEGVCNLPDRGRFICLDSDTFECEEGWRGQSCDDCIPATGCSRTGGYCNTPGECTCKEGYDGTHCVYPICQQGCHSVGGYCSMPGECVCRNGWSGEHCDQCIPASGCSSTGGYCVQPGECRCRIGFVGDTCSTPVSVLPPCTANNTLCQNGGTCTSVGTSHSICVCPPSHSGLYCEEGGSTDTGTDQQGDGTARLVDVMIAVVVAMAAIIVTAIVATCILVYKVFMRRRAVQRLPVNNDVIENNRAELRENEEPPNQGHEQVQEPQNQQVQGGIGELVDLANPLPPHQQPRAQCAVMPVARGNNEIIQGVNPLAEDVPQRLPNIADENFLNQRFQFPANDPRDLQGQTPNRQP